LGEPNQKEGPWEWRKPLIVHTQRLQVIISGGGKEVDLEKERVANEKE